MAMLLFTAAACGGKGDGPVTPPPPGPPATVKVVSGDAQEGTVGIELPGALVVRVLDAAGRPVPGQPVSFVVTGGGGTVYAGASLTNADGRAQERWTLGTTAGQAQSLEARAVDAATGAKLLFATFTATAKAGPLASLAAVSGDGQQGTVGSALAQPLVVESRDAFGNAVAGGTVTWSVATGGGSLGTTTSPVGANGRAEVSWTLGATPGAQTVTAQSSGKSFTFSATATSATPPPPGPPTTIRVVSGDAQEALVGTELPAALVVRVLDAGGRAVSGQSVSFVVTSGGGSVFAGASVTNADGQAQERWTIGTSTAQPQRVEVRAVDPQSGQKLPTVTFTAVPKAGPATSLALVSGNGQAGPAGSTLPQPLVVIARDAYGNPTSGATITWTVATGGGTLSSTTAATGIDGNAQATWTLGGSTGTQSVTAQTAGKTVSFTASVSPALRWALMTTPTIETLLSIWGASATDVWAVGNAGTILHYDGTSWTKQQSGTSANITRVWGVSATEVYASTASSILKYDGVSWTSFPKPPALSGKLVSTWIASPTVAIASLNETDAAFGADSLLLWDGTSWKTLMRNAGDIKAVFIDPAGRGVAGKGISTSGGAINDGSGWKTGFGFRTLTMYGTSFDDYWVRSGSNGPTAFLRHYSGGTSDFSGSGDDFPYEPGWFVSSSEVYLLRFSFTTPGERSVVRFSAGSTIPIEESIKGWAMWGSSSAQLFVVGSGGHIYRNTR